jgi:hypothetical protein
MPLESKVSKFPKREHKGEESHTFMSAFGHVPTGRLGTQEYKANHNDRRQTRGPHHQSPIQTSNS